MRRLRRFGRPGFWRPRRVEACCAQDERDADDLRRDAGSARSRDSSAREPKQAAQLLLSICFEGAEIAFEYMLEGGASFVFDEIVEDFLESFDNLCGLLRTQATVLREKIEGELNEPRRDVWANVGEIRRRLVHDAMRSLRVIPAVETTSGKRLVEHNAEGKKVRPVIDGTKRELLGAHVARLALEDPNGGFGLASNGFDDAEVRELHGSVPSDQNVLRRDVAVDQIEGSTTWISGFVGGAKSASDVEQNPHHRLQGEQLASRPFDERREGQPVDVLHDHEGPLGILSDIKHGDDVLVSKEACDPRLFAEHRGGPRIVPEGAEDALAGKETFKATVRAQNELHRSHTAPLKLSDEGILSGRHAMRDYMIVRVGGSCASASKREVA